jgi:hypothetical protein
VFGGIATRFDRPVRDPKVRVARRLITRAVLTPSRVFDDTSAWTRMPGNTRLALWRGLADRDRYRFIVDPGTALPSRPGEGRDEIRLTRLSPAEFEWNTVADFGIGATTPAAVAMIPVVWIAAGERADTGGIRSDIRTAFPNSAREWGRLFSLERIESTRDQSGAWTQRHIIVLHPDAAAKTYPEFGKWLREYVSPLRIRMRLHDGTRTWFDGVVRNDSMILRLRSRDGRLVPLEGGLAEMPDVLTIETDFSAKLSVFRVGFSALRGQFTTVRQANERGWSLRFTSDPEWDLPPLAERMLRTPLRRPFAGSGSAFRITAIASPGTAQTFLTRRITVPVQESAILRFLSRLANTGVDSYVEGADRETNQWLSAAFAALRDDSRAVLNTPAPPR